MTNLASLQQEAASLGAILASEPDGMGGTLIETDYYRRELALIEIDVRTVDALGARLDLAPSTLEALVAITAARLVLRMATLAVEAVGAAASVDRVGLGHNSHIAPLRSADAVAHYGKALQSHAAADEQGYASLSAMMGTPDGLNGSAIK